MVHVFQTQEREAMTSMRAWRKIVKGSVFLFLGWEIATTLVGLAVLILIVVRGGTPSTDSLISIVGVIGVYGVLIWAIRDARMRSHLKSPGGLRQDES
jgi:hypothetical protein